MLSGLCAQTNTKEKRFPLNNDMPNNSNYIYLLFRTCELGGCKDEKFKRYTCILLIQLQVEKFPSTFYVTRIFLFPLWCPIWRVKFAILNGYTLQSLAHCHKCWMFRLQFHYKCYECRNSILWSLSYFLTFIPYD